jgi:hypothetical protein
VTYTHPRRIRKWVERGIKLSKLTSKKMSFGFKKFLSPHDLLIFFGFHATNSAFFYIFAQTVVGGKNS